MADLEGIQVGEFGKTIWLYCKNKGVIQNISGYDFDRAGEWKGQVWLEKAGYLIKSNRFTAEVGE